MRVASFKIEFQDRLAYNFVEWVHTGGCAF